MKKLFTILIELLLLFNLAVCLYTDIQYIRGWVLIGYSYNTLALLSFIGSVTCLTAIVLIAIKDFPVFKPLADKLTARKEKHAQAKAERAEEAKQAKIQAIEAKLEELKNN